MQSQIYEFEYENFDDAKNIVNVLLMILVYLTPIFYPISILTNELQLIVNLNPLTSYLDIFRWAFSNNSSVTSLDFIYIGFSSFFALYLGVFIFRKYWNRIVVML